MLNLFEKEYSNVQKNLEAVKSYKSNMQMNFIFKKKKFS